MLFGRSRHVSGRWLRRCAWAGSLAALVLVVLVPLPLRGVLATTLIVAALGLLVWRLPMADED
ncbi:MAG: hypothetical protein ACHQ4H_00840 [Ktedonobacterales bacterium]